MYAEYNSSGTANGCDSCASLDDAYGSSMNGGMAGTDINRMIQQATQNNVMNQHANNVLASAAASAAQPQVVVIQPNAVAATTGGNNRPAIPNVATAANNNSAKAANAKAAMNNMVKKALNNQSINVEGFKAGDPSNLMTSAITQIPGSCLFLNIGLVALAALALNETFKYYINKAIQSAEGQTYYYLMYAVLGLLMVVGGHYYTKYMCENV